MRNEVIQLAQSLYSNNRLERYHWQLVTLTQIFLWSTQ